MAKLCPKLNQNQLQELQCALKKVKDSSESKRIQAVLMVDERENPQRIEKFTGMKRSRVFGLRKLYLLKGLSVLRSKPKKVKSLLTKKQLKEIVNTLTTPKSSLAVGYNVPFWTTSMLVDYVWRTYQVKYRSKTSYYALFKRSKFTFHKPGRISVKRNDKDVRLWREKAKKKIEKAWRKENTVIICEDEAILSTQTTFQKIWLPEGDYPKIETSVTRKNKSLYGFLNIKTGREHAFSFDKQNMYKTVKALKQLRRIYPKKLNKRNKLPGYRLLILWDNPGWHRGSEVTKYLKRDNKIKIIYFPKYAPEENPQEHVWKKLKSEIIHNRLIENIEAITVEALNYLNNKNFCYSLLGFSPIFKC
jgi:transposase